jgi:thiol-disulfide isomerase/thioredoxin
MTQPETPPESPPSPSPSPMPTRNRTWPVVVGVFLAFWGVYLLVAGPRAPDEIDLDAPGRPAEYNWTLQDLDGRPVKFSEYEGKAVFLNIWATWCPPCVGEMPSIARLAGDPRWQGKNIAFVCAATDHSLETVRQYVSDKKWPMTILHADGLPGAFLTDGIPATFIIAPDGRVVSMTEGGREWDDPGVVKSLEAVAAIPPRTPAPLDGSPPSS